MSKTTGEGQARLRRAQNVTRGHAAGATRTACRRRTEIANQCAPSGIRPSRARLAATSRLGSVRTGRERDRGQEKEEAVCQITAIAGRVRARDETLGDATARTPEGEKTPARSTRWSSISTNARGESRERDKPRDASAASTRRSRAVASENVTQRRSASVRTNMLVAMPIRDRTSSSE